MAPAEDSQALAEMSLFEGLSDSELATLRQHLHRKVFPGGTHVFTVAERGDVVYMLVDGSVKIYVDQEDGSEVILAFLGPGDTFGEMGLVDSAGRSASVLTLEKCECLAMNQLDFHRSLQTMSRLSYNLVRLLSRRLRLANEQIQSLSTLDVRGRVARQFLAFAQRYGQDEMGDRVKIPLRLTQSDIASLVGASRERVNQVIVDFKESGFLSVDARHRFTVLDLQALIDRCR
ncbi:MAG: Crp/Fnr family transcriptional regulator [Thermoanaerobaculia bacterium]|nr:Crp/Fnr family transcriptional regulator [Thermoanaerobaculia bacterium]